MRLREKWEDDSIQLGKLANLQMIKAIIYGLSIGDALGVPVEFRERDSFHISNMEGYGTYHQPSGTWSDDTSLSLALIEHLYEESDLNGLMDKFVAYRTGYLTPHGQCFDIGIATNKAIDAYLSGVSPEECGGKCEDDNGNGALMRISPLSMLLRKNFNFTEKFSLIEKYTKITHGHPRSLVASIIYVQILIGLLLNNSLSKVLEQYQPHFENYFKRQPSYWKEYETHFKEIFQPSFFEKDRSEVASTGYVVDTLKAVIWCVGITNGFEEAVLKAVNLGGDTDTIGAITGTLAAALYQLESLPKDWIDQLANKVLIDEKCHQLLDTLYKD
ncbi:ADP-ribosylglycohydrolase [Streptococcus cuniculi]|uniref:ADP-ribosylglycohydrolase n=1 Tax=Streptococcus cuniculi TaxID=1432788 RepID=A0A1Q8E9E6_9STRE|nr:ADP-ribosylglycohydrolase family protein [Streptococcus cuniculi]OLF48420.1 ADP-ribosylglycohydrolase [Streptococcus cuniculi]